jgi:hypothetical protein
MGRNKTYGTNNDFYCFDGMNTKRVVDSACSFFVAAFSILELMNSFLPSILSIFARRMEHEFSGIGLLHIEFKS